MRNFWTCLLALLLVSCTTNPPWITPLPSRPPLPPMPSAPVKALKLNKAREIRVRVTKLKLTPPTSVTLAWDASTDPTVVGYNVYQGVASGVYTNRVDAGTNTTVTLTGIPANITNYFAATSYTADPLESDYSKEVAYKLTTPTQFTIGFQLFSSTNASGPYSFYTNLPPVVVPNNGVPMFFQGLLSITNN